MTKNQAEMAEISQARDDTRAKRRNLLREIVGKNQFDDRIDVQSDLTSAEAVRVLGRSLRQIASIKGLFAIKVALEFLLIVPGLYAPWIAKILIDNVINQEAFNATEVRYPPFMDPILNLVQGQDPMQIMFTLTLVSVLGLLTLGYRIGGLGAGLLQGQDAATQSENQTSASYSSGGGLAGLAAFMVGVRLTQRLANQMRTRLFTRLSRLPLSALDDQRTGDSIYRVLYDVPMLPDLFHQLTIVPFFMMLNGVISLYIMEYSYGAVSPELIWIAYLTVPVAFVITFPFSGAIRRTSQNKRAAGSATTNAIEQSVDNVSAVQSLGATDQETERFAKKSAESFLRERYYIAVIIVCVAVFGSITGIAAIYVTVLISDRIIDGIMTVGDFVTLFLIFNGIVIPASYLGAYWIKIQDVIAAARRVFFFMDFESEEDRTDGEICEDIERDVVFENVSFSYPNGHEALKEINLKFEINQLVAIVGPTGSGKTTLAYLIPSLLTPSSGRVLIDGQDAINLNLLSIRRHMAYVLQEHSFLTDTIRNNLLLANPQASEQQLWNALELAGCTDFVQQLPEGLDTRLGRGGDTLSLGQQQRLSIARGLTRNSRILILDEPTAALDPKTEVTLLRSLRSASSERLVVVIAHRLSTIREADQIVFLEDGRVLESGSHDELMGVPDGRYRDFVGLQIASNEKLSSKAGTTDSQSE